MPTRSAVRDQFRRYLTQPGNWRLKGLLLALETSPRIVAEAWPVSPAERRSLQRRVSGYTPPIERGYTLAHRPESRELAAAREVFDADDAHALQYGTGIDYDRYISETLRELASDANTELDVLWREALTDTVQAGAATRKIAREATTVTNVDARRGDLPVAEQEPFASNSQEGTEPDLTGEDYTSRAFVCEKFEHGFAVSDNLVDAARIDVIERQIRTAGAAVENAINRQYLTNAIDNAGVEEDVAANEAVVQSLLEAVENVSDNDFDPVDVFVFHPELRTEFADDPAQASINWTGAPDADGVFGRAWGLDLFVASDATYNGLSTESLVQSNTYGWEADGEFGGVVHGRQFVHTVVYRDIEVSDLEPPFTAIHDVQGGVAAAQTDSVLANANAVARLER